MTVAARDRQKRPVWVDLTNAPHVRFFLPFLPGWQERFGVHVTARDHSNTLQLLEEFRVPHVVIGGHRSTVIAKAAGLAWRTLRLGIHLRRVRPAVGVSQSSFYSPPAGFLAGVPTIYTNDNEHAAGNRIAFRYATIVFVPESFPEGALPRDGQSRSRVRRYPGVKEAMYLLDEVEGLRELRTAQEEARRKRPRLYARAEPWKAQYYDTRDDHLVSLLREVAEACEIHLLPRGEAQARILEKELPEPVVVRRDVVTLEELARYCSLFVSAGGTMGRETAVLGIPTVSIYKGDLLAVDRWLLEREVLSHDPLLEAKSLLARLGDWQPATEGLEEIWEAARRARRSIEDAVTELATGDRG